MIINLLGNALKFTSRGEVSVKVEVNEPLNEIHSTSVMDVAGFRVSTTTVDFQTHTESRLDASHDLTTAERPFDSVCLRFTVSDTGIGIPSDKRDQLFNAFIQADSSTTRKYGGTGLGLVICRKLVEMMGGRIWFESEAGHGSQFYFTACFGVQTNPVDKPAKLVPDDLAGLRVLIVDDNATNRRILTQVITGWRMKPTPVDSGAAAMETLLAAVKAREPFSLILMDVMMPGMDGFMVLGASRSCQRMIDQQF